VEDEKIECMFHKRKLIHCSGLSTKYVAWSILWNGKKFAWYLGGDGKMSRIDNVYLANMLDSEGFTPL